MNTKSRTIDIIIPVYNGASTIVANINRLLKLPITGNWEIRIFVVDDASTDATAALIAGLESPRLSLLQLSKNSGRAAARDFAARKSSADYLLFLDSDCTPDRNDYLQIAITTLEKNANLVFGPIGGTGSGFWARYLTDIEEKRNQHAKSNQWINAITSANLLVERGLYTTAGGFNSEYRHYGFEDRDLILRLLAAKPRIAYSQAMRVCHDANNTVWGYCKKMETAARYSAPLFFRDHPEQYKKMSYGSLDLSITNSQWLKIIGPISGTIKHQFIKTASYLVNKNLSPYPVTKIAVQTAAALSYIHGTTRHCQEDNP